MNWPYIHTLINHFPIILTVVGAAGVVSGFIWKTRGAWLYAVATLTLAGLSAYPAFFTGDEASDVMRHKWYIVRSMIDRHDDAAGIALWLLLITGAIAAYAWWRMTRRERSALPPTWLRGAIAVATLAALISVTWAAYLGGQIVHDSPRLATMPAGVDTTSTSPSPP